MLEGMLTRRTAIGRSAAFRDAPEWVEVASDLRNMPVGWRSAGGGDQLWA